MKENDHFGEHLMLDGYLGSEAALNDQERVLDFLSKLPDMLDMHRLSEPQIFSCVADEHNVKDPGGLTGIVLIAESHISIHTFPKRGFATADAYSCKSGMNTELIIDYFKKLFEFKDVDVNFLKRGLRYPPANIY